MMPRLHALTLVVTLMCATLSAVEPVTPTGVTTAPPVNPLTTLISEAHLLQMIAHRALENAHAHKDAAETGLMVVVVENPDDAGAAQDATIKLRIAETQLADASTSISSIDRMIGDINRLTSEIKALNTGLAQSDTTKAVALAKASDKKMKAAKALVKDMHAIVDILKRRWLITRKRAVPLTETPEK